ncbi:GntR family transcriptional regulator [Fusobacterium sp. PH5-44]|uniref:GntR family transcriptional regulator n=1 Tax=unclassified Fusobacterium TaxID=2648384 RepID=UPI003D1C20C5
MNSTLKLLLKNEKENNRDFAYRVIKYNIFNMNLPPGCTINENEFAEQLGLSRTPIHEALTLLKSEYLVDIIPQSGSRVSLINFQNIKDGVFLRNTVEPAIYKELANHLTAEYSGKIERNLDEILKLIENERDDIEERVSIFELDDEFHSLAYEAANRSLLWDAVKKVCTHFDRIRYAESILKKSNMHHVYDEHMMIYEYLLVGGMPNFDFEKYYDNHLTFFKGFFFQLYKDNPEYFILDDRK